MIWPGLLSTESAGVVAGFFITQTHALINHPNPLHFMTCPSESEMYSYIIMLI